MSYVLKLFFLVNPLIILSQALELSDPQYGPIQDYWVSGHNQDLLIVYDSKIVVKNVPNKNPVHEIEHPQLNNIKRAVTTTDNNIFFIATLDGFYEFNIQENRTFKVFGLDAPPSLLMPLPDQRIAIGTTGKELMIYDQKEKVISSTHQVSGVVTSLFFDKPSNSILFITLEGELLKLDSSGNIKLIYDIGSACFDLAKDNSKNIIAIGSTKYIHQFNIRDNTILPYDKKKTNAWTTTLSYNINSLAFGLGSGKVIIEAPMLTYKYQLNSSIKKLNLLDNPHSKIQLVVLTESNRLYYLDGMMMKIK